METIIQNRGESLRNYVLRFNIEALKIPYLDHAWAIEVITKGKNNPQFFNSLSKNRPSDLIAQMDRVEKYI